MTDQIQNAIEQEAEELYSLERMRVISEINCLGAAADKIRETLPLRKLLTEAYIAGRSKALEEKEKEISDLKKEVEKWKDEYGAMEKIIADYQVMNNKLAGARDLVFHYWRKEHLGVPSFRIQDEWELYKSENNL